MLKDLTKLVEEVTDKKVGRRCFYTRLEADLQRYLDILGAMYVKDRSVVFTEVQKVLEREFDVSISDSSIKRHIKGICLCRKRKQKK